MSEVIDLVFIMDDDQYKRFEKFADQGNASCSLGRNG